jgi:hypothetical protein
MKKLLCLDFDGVLHSYGSGWKGARNIPDPPTPGAMDFLLRAVEQFEVAIFSSRSRYFGGRTAMKRWLRESIFDHLWERYPARGVAASYLTASDIDDQLWPEVNSLVGRLSFPRWKPAAFLTLDDRAITFTGKWPNLPELLDFKPWNKK